MPAFTDEKMITLVKKAFGEFVDHNKKYLCRIYPCGSRYESVNYNPLPAWSVGSQMVCCLFFVVTVDNYERKRKMRTELKEHSFNTNLISPSLLISPFLFHFFSSLEIPGIGRIELADSRRRYVDAGSTLQQCRSLSTNSKF
jgi:hypothetical protein